MEIIIELIKIIVPSALVLYGMYLTVQLFLEKQFEQKKIEVKYKNSEIITPLRLQAYERMTLFLERITPNNLFVRLGSMATQAPDFQQVILREIREEFNHNLAQQVYMSHEAWEKISHAMNEVQTLINTSAAEVSPTASALDLSKKVFEKVITENKQPTADALKFLKEEVQALFVV